MADNKFKKMLLMIRNIALQNIKIYQKIVKDIITYHVRYTVEDGTKTLNFILYQTVVCID